jgi:hypothetical protein
MPREEYIDMPGFARVVLGAVVLAALTGCNFAPGIVPPFDASGSFDGRWSGQVNGLEDQTNSCVVKLDLVHDALGLVPGSAYIEGEIRVNFTCPSVYSQIRDSVVPAIYTVPVQGYITGSGRILIGVVESTRAYDIALGLDAQGFDDDDDNRMDRIEGEFNLVVRVDKDTILTVDSILMATPAAPAGE